MRTRAPQDHNPRPQTRELIEHMLDQRKHMLVLLSELSTFDRSKVDTQLRGTLEDFLNTMVDYIAAGHFGLYQRIVDGSERRQAVLETAREITGKISDTKDVALEFNERYGAADDVMLNDHLANDLSTLGEKVATRIELEDQLILAMLGDDYSIPRVEH